MKLRAGALGLMLAATLFPAIATAAPPLPVDEGRAADPLAPPHPDLEAGARIYRDRCASCHDTPSGRTPARDVISQNTRTFIVSALTEGVMKPMAQGLSYGDIGSVAAFLARAESGGIATQTLKSPACKGKAAPFTLSPPKWNGWGVDAANTRFQRDPGLSAADVPRLKVKWAFHHAGGRVGQATVVGGRVFTNSSSGSVYSLDAKTGCAWWRFAADAGTRTTIVVGALPGAAPARFAAYFADQSRHVYAIDAETGALLWKTDVDNQAGVQMTGSLTLSEGRVFVPISSAEEAIAENDAYECCKFRGAVVALDAASGKLLWKTYTTPTEPRPFKKNAKGTQMYGPAGAAIWSAPTADEKRHLIYVATGDSYTDVPNSGADAIMALDAVSGAVRWIKQVTEDDNFIIGCSGARDARANCPTHPGRDSDFGASPILHTLPGGHDVILAAQKSSEVYGLDPDNKGAILWHRRLSPGGPLGGVEFGPAADGDTLYVAISDVFLGPMGKPGLSALRISDGAIEWTAPALRTSCAWKNIWCDPAMSQAISVVPGIVFAGSMDGHFRAYETASGKVVWDDDSAAAREALGGRQAAGGVLDGAGPTIADGMIYVSSGYQGRAGNAGSLLLAYSVDGR